MIIQQVTVKSGSFSHFSYKQITWQKWAEAYKYCMYDELIYIRKSKMFAVRDIIQQPF